jgi:hypothetical protein
MPKKKQIQAIAMTKQLVNTLLPRDSLVCQHGLIKLTR